MNILFNKISFILFFWTFGIQSQWIIQDFKIRGTNNLNDIVFTQNQKGCLVGNSGIIYITNDSGMNWTKVQSQTHCNLRNIFFIDSTKGWIVGDSGCILMSNNGGIVWNRINSGITKNLYSVFFINDSIGWTAGINSIYKTSNQGNSWTLQKSSSVSSYFSIFFIDTDNGFVVGDSSGTGIILKTTNGGNNWFTILKNYPGWLTDIYFLDGGSTGFIVGENNTILKTTNSGNSWFYLTPIGPSIYNWDGLFFIDENTGWAVGGGGTIIRTTNGGLNWTTQRGHLGNFNWIGSVFFINSETGWAVGLGFDSTYYGELLKTSNGGISYIHELSFEQKQFELYQNYPNPYNSFTNILYSLIEPSKVTLNIYNLIGQKVTTVINAFQNEGYYKVVFDSKMLNSGIYFYTLEVNRSIETRKMIILK